MRPVTGTTVIMPLRISRESLDEHAADDAAACCHNAGTARIHPLAEIGISGHRPARDPGMCTAHHLGYLLNRAPASRVGHPRGRTQITLVWAAALDPVRCLTTHTDRRECARPL